MLYLFWIEQEYIDKIKNNFNWDQPFDNHNGKRRPYFGPLKYRGVNIFIPLSTKWFEHDDIPDDEYVDYDKVVQKDIDEEDAFFVRNSQQEIRAIINFNRLVPMNSDKKYFHKYSDIEINKSKLLYLEKCFISNKQNLSIVINKTKNKFDELMNENYQFNNLINYLSSGKTIYSCEPNRNLTFSSDENINTNCSHTFNGFFAAAVIIFLVIIAIVCVIVFGTK